ncbi:MAG: hypothetical protein AB7I18_05825 [Candidatus Berkiella sp.]
MFYSIFNIKRNIWQISFAIFFLCALAAGSFLTTTFAGLLLFKISLDLWSYFRFQSYSVNDATTNQPRTWQSILEEFNSRSGRTAFYGVSRNDIKSSLERIMSNGQISQGNNNLCGPIAFLELLIKHQPALFAKTFCEYFENGGTYAPFYLHSPFWDRYAYFLPTGLINRIFPNHYQSPEQALAAAFKNSSNLMGYNNSCLLETFKGSTEPKQMVEWLNQAGFSATSNVTLNNYRNNDEMPLLARFFVGGIYSSDNRSKEPNNHVEGEECYFKLSQSQGSSALHYLFNVSSAHWTFGADKNPAEQNFIQIHLPKRNART